MKISKTVCGALALAGTLGVSTAAQASSHREALAILNDPCVDNTDLYAWVTPGTHDKMYLMAGYNGLHEPGQGNQQTRLCDDVLYEFHIARGNGALNDAVTYQVQFSSTAPTPVKVDDLTLPPGGGKELLIQLGGVTQTYTVTKVEKGKKPVVIGKNLPVTPPNVGPHTDRIVYKLGAFDPANPDSHSKGLYDDAFVKTFISPLGTGGSEGRAWTGTRDDPFYLDEKGIFDVINLQAQGKSKDVFAGFNLNMIALEVPTTALTGTGALPAHNGTPGNDTLVGVWASASRRKHRVLRSVGEDVNYGHWVQVGREGLPLVNAGLIGVQDQTKYLRTTPLTDVANFGGYFLNPILVRDVEFLGIYKALGVPDATVQKLKSGRVDILKTINLDDIPTPGAHSVPIEPGKTGDVLRVDLAIDSAFPNGRPIPGGKQPNMEQADVSDVLLTVIVAGGALPISDGVQYNDKSYLNEFPWAALPWQGWSEGHGKTTPLCGNRSHPWHCPCSHCSGASGTVPYRTARPRLPPRRRAGARRGRRPGICASPIPAAPRAPTRRSALRRSSRARFPTRPTGGSPSGGRGWSSRARRRTPASFSTSTGASRRRWPSRPGRLLPSSCGPCR